MANSIAFNQQLSRTSLHQQLQLGLVYGSVEEATAALSGVTWPAAGDIVTISGENETKAYIIHATGTTHNDYKNSFRLIPVGNGDTRSGDTIVIGEYEEVEYPKTSQESDPQPYVTGAVNVNGDMTISSAFTAVETTISALTQEILDSEQVIYKTITAITSGAGLDQSDDGKIAYIPNSENPILSAATSLWDADEKLSDYVSGLYEEVSGLTDEISGITSGAGLVYDDGTVKYVANSENPILSAATSLTNADVLLYEEISGLTAEFSGLYEEVSGITEFISGITSGAGLTYDDGKIKYEPNSDNPYLSDARTLKDADEKLSRYISGITDNAGFYYDSYDGTVLYRPNEENVILSATTSLMDADENLSNCISGIASGAGLTAKHDDYDHSVISFKYVPNENNNILRYAESLWDADEKLSQYISGLTDAAGLDYYDGAVHYPQSSQEILYDATSLTTADDVLAAAIIDVSGITEDVCEKAGLTFSDGSVSYPQSSQEILYDATGLTNADDILAEAIDDISGITEEVCAKAGLDYYDGYVSYTPPSIDILRGSLSLNQTDEKLYNYFYEEISGLTDEISSISSNIKISNNYEEVEQPEYLQGNVPVQPGYSMDTAFHAVETTISALTQETINNEEVVYNITTAITSGTGLDKTLDGAIKYTPDVTREYISAATSLYDADVRMHDVIAQCANIDFIESITYADLVTLRNNSGLTIGKQYHITDYECNVDYTNASAATNPFDIIVVATENDTLSENARAIHRDGTSYFNDSNVAAWEIKYCLDNDKTRFPMCDADNGHGWIYFMKDEWGNSCYYDFKNVQWKDTDNKWYYTFTNQSLTISSVPEPTEMFDATVNDRCKNCSVGDGTYHVILRSYSDATLDNIKIGNNCYNILVEGAYFSNGNEAPSAYSVYNVSVLDNCSFISIRGSYWRNNTDEVTILNNVSSFSSYTTYNIVVGPNHGQSSTFTGHGETNQTLYLLGQITDSTKVPIDNSGAWGSSITSSITTVQEALDYLLSQLSS